MAWLKPAAHDRTRWSSSKGQGAAHASVCCSIGLSESCSSSSLSGKHTGYIRGSTATVERHRGGRHRTGPKRRARRTRGTATGRRASPNDPQCPQHTASPRGTRRWTQSQPKRPPMPTAHRLPARGTRRWQPNTHSPRQASVGHPLARRTTQSTPGPIKPARPPPPPKGPRACCSQTVPIGMPYYGSTR